MLGFYFKILSTLSLAISLSFYMLIASVMFGKGWGVVTIFTEICNCKTPRVGWLVHSFLPYVFFFFLILEKSDND